MEEDSIPPAALCTDSNFSFGRCLGKSTFMLNVDRHSDCKRAAGNMTESSAFQDYDCVLAELVLLIYLSNI